MAISGRLAVAPGVRRRGLVHNDTLSDIGKFFPDFGVFGDKNSATRQGRILLPLDLSVTIDTGSRASSRLERADGLPIGIRRERGRLGRLKQKRQNLGGLYVKGKSAIRVTTSGREMGNQIDLPSGRDFSVGLCLFPSFNTVP